MNSMAVVTGDCRSPRQDLTSGISLEITARDGDALRRVAGQIMPQTSMSITDLPGEPAQARIAAARLVRDLGFEPMPHLAARRFKSLDDLAMFVSALREQADVRKCFIVAGDPAVPAGPFATSMDMIETGLFEASGIRIIGVGGHPEGSPHMTAQQSLDVLAAKCAEIERRGMQPMIVTQFAFDATPIIAWLETIRAHGIDAPVRIGLPGPASIKTLLRFAAHCGVGASAAVLAKYGISLTKLIGSAGPDRLVADLQRSLGSGHGEVGLHLYPFGGIEQAVKWTAAAPLLSAR